MDKKTREELGEFFAESFKEVVLPHLEDLKEDVDELKENMATKDDIDGIKRQLMKKDERMDRHGINLENHEKRIKKIETKTRVATI